jgi:hypothetical protein
MKTSLALLDLLTGFLFGWFLFGAWIAAHLAQGGAQIPPVFWVGVAGNITLLIATGVTLVRPKVGAATGLIGCLLVWVFWGPLLMDAVRLAVEGEGGMNVWTSLGSLLLLAASVLSGVVLARGAGPKFVS